MSRWRDLLQPERSTDRHRELARPLQHQAAALCTWLSTTRTTGDQTTARPDAHHELTSHSAWYKISVRPIPRAPKRGHSLFAALSLAHVVALAAGALERPLPAFFVAGERLLHDAADDLAI